MALKPEISVPAALALGVAVYGIFQVNLPSLTEVRAADMDNTHIASAERAATWESAGLVATISLISKDPTIFLVGGVFTMALAWKYRHANMVHPATGKLGLNGSSAGMLAAMGAKGADGASLPAAQPGPVAASAAPASYAAVI